MTDDEAQGPGAGAVPHPPRRLSSGRQVRALLDELAVCRAVGLTLASEGEIALAGDGTPGVGPPALVPAEALAQAWRDAVSPPGPYLVLCDAKAVLAWFHGRGLGAPRFGDVRVGHVLLAERGAAAQASAREILSEWGGLALDAPTSLHAPEARHRYAAAAARAQVEALRAMTPKLRALGLGPLFELECRVQVVVAAMERVGMPVDAAAFQRVVDDWAAQRAKARDPARIARLDKLLSTYGHWPRTFVDLDGRIRSHFDPLAADSGRFSCSEPNLQQVPTERTAPGLRACFRAPPGRTFVVADYAQIELRVAAALAPCEALAAVFRGGGDPHRATAATLTGKAPEAVTKQERTLAKAVNFGFLFGMGARTFRSYARASYGLDLDERAARQAKDAFFRTYPGLAAWHRRTAALGRRPGPVTVRTRLGRRKRFEPGRFSLPSALNIPVQGTAAEGFKRALVDLAPRIAPLDGHIVLCVHDEIVVEVPEAAAKAARAAVVRAMQAGMAPLLGGIPVEVEAEVTPHWL